MGFDLAAVERVAVEVSRVFADSLQSAAREAAKEAEQTRQRLDDEARALAEGQAKLEEGWRQLNLERQRLSIAAGDSIGAASCQQPAAQLKPGTAPGALRYDTPPRMRPAGAGAPPEKPAEKESPAKKAAAITQDAQVEVADWGQVGLALLAASTLHVDGEEAESGEPPESVVVPIPPIDMSCFSGQGSRGERLKKKLLADLSKVELLSQAVDPWNYVPAECQVTFKDHAYSVLPVQRPDAAGMGHDLWNHIVEVPEGWEVLSSEDGDFGEVIAALSRHRWGSLVLGVRGSRQSFDAYWTPLFGDGGHAGVLCQEDVDWIEPVDGSSNRFRMTYSGLRLVMRRPAASQVAGERGR